MRIPRLTVALAAMLASHVAVPAWAFDGLMAIAERLPVSADHTEELYFMSPAAVAGWQPSDFPGIGLPELASALFDADLGIEKVGFAFPELDGIANFGTVPHATLHLLGTGIQPEAVGEALLRRPEMERFERLEVTVFAEGEDNAVDVTARDPAYPFGGGWRSHRVAVWDGGAIVAYSWDDLEAALAGAGSGDESPSGANTRRWRLADLVAAAATNAPANAGAFAATGLPGAAFLVDDDAATGNGAAIPAFEYALYVASTSGASEAVQMVLAYEEAADAVAALNAAKARLVVDIGERYPDGTTIIGRTTELPGGGAAAVISVVYPPGMEGHPSSYEIGRWTNDALSRRLEILAVGS